MSRRVVPLVLILLLLIIHVQLWQGRGSLAGVQQLQAWLDAQKARNAEALLVNKRLDAEVHDLKEGLEMVEEKARGELGMVKPNEIYVQLNK